MISGRPVHRRVLTALALLLAAGCESGTTAPDALDVPVIQAAKPTSNGGGKDAGPTVKEVNPSFASQDATLDLEVLGSNFDDGSKVSFALSLVDTDLIKTNHVTFVSKRKLVANITVALNAEVASYDVIVTTFKGRRGIGTELLDIFVKGSKPAEPIQVSTTFPEYLANEAHNDFMDDGKGPYVGGVCGVKSFVQNNVDTHFYSFRPVDNGLSRKAKKDLDKDCADFPRTSTINITDTTIVHIPAEDGDRSDHSGDLELGALADTVAAILHPADTLRRGISAAVGQMPPNSGDFFVGGSFNVKYCILDGSGPPFLFNTSREPLSDSLVVTRTFFDVFQVSTQPYPNNVGHCTHEVDGVSTPLLLHMNLAYEVKPPPKPPG